MVWPSFGAFTRVFWIFVWCFLKLFAQLSLIRYIYNNPERRKRATIVCLLKKILQGACADVFTRPTLANIVAVPYKRAQHCCATLRRSQNNRNVGTSLAKSLTGFKLYATSANKCQHCCGSMQTDATRHNIGRQCCVHLHEWNLGLYRGQGNWPSKCLQFFQKKKKSYADALHRVVGI